MGLLGKGNRGITHEDYAAIAITRGVRPIEEYVRSNVRIQHECIHCGHQMGIIPNGLTRSDSKSSKNPCPFCGGRKWTHEKYVAELAKVHPTIIVTDVYINQMTKISHQCTTCGHTWNTWPDTLLNGRGGCSPCSKNKNSSTAIRWLDQEAKRRRIKIQHAKNGGEYVLPELGIRVDGFNKRTRTVFEFHGDAFHGNPKMYAATTRCHPYNKAITAAELYKRTREREKRIKKAGYNLVVMWEFDFKRVGKCLH